MCKRKQCIELIRQNLPYIQTEFDVEGICLFGSTARGANKVGSDVDLLIDMPPKIFLISRLKDYLENLLNTSVDIIRRHANLSQKFINEITLDGIILL